MSVAVPVTGEQICEICNLPTSMNTKPIWGKFQYSVLEWLEKYLTAENYAFISTECECPLALHNSSQLAYSFIILNQTIDFLNLNTIGNGIVKKTGMGSDAVELLSGSELTKYKQTLEAKALEVLEKYLNVEGTHLLNKMKPINRKSNFRACFISNTSEIDE